MWFKYPIIILVFFICAILQQILFAYFAIMGIVPNVIFSLFFVFIFFESKHDYEMGFWAAIIAGIFLDALLPSYFGISIISLLIVYILEKLVVHFFKEGKSKFSIFYFIPLFACSLVIYSLALYLLSRLFGFQVNIALGFNLITTIIYNLGIACIFFYLYKIFLHKNSDENQLKLL